MSRLGQKLTMILACFAMVIVCSDAAAQQRDHKRDRVGASGAGDASEAANTNGAVAEIRAVEVSPNLAEFVTPIPPGLATHRLVVDTHGNRLTASTAGIPSAKLVYSNNLGNFVFGPGGFFFNARIADDLATIAQPGCTLDSYVIRVNGDRSFDGLGLGDYTVTTALHNICPGAQPDPIPGTQTDTPIRIGIDVTTEAETAEIVVKMPSGVNIDIADVHYISVRFSRDHAGVVVGAPATVGFSGDRFDFPGTPCIAVLGPQPFPVVPHASFGVDLYVREASCPVSHVAYRNTNNAGRFRTEGPGVFFAQSLRIGVPLCNLIGWEIALKGNGAVQADLRTALSVTDPDLGFLIPGSRRLFISSSTTGIQIGRHMLPEPFPLTSPDLFMVFRTTSSQVGPLLTCNPPVLGDSPNAIFRFDFQRVQWLEVRESGNCVLNFDITLLCENLPPPGACCDMIFLDDQNEAVCRDGLAQMNCPFPQLWQQGDLCAGTCIGGSNDSAACTRQADCLGGDCDGPFPDPCGIAACCKPLDASPGGCENLTLNQCIAVEPLANPRIFDRARFCGRGEQSCPTPACFGRRGACTIDHPERGCGSPFCCQDVCDFDPFCCQVEWDALCVRESQEFGCRATNDKCFINIFRGAKVVSTNSSTTVGTLTATASDSDPGFCCHSGVEGDPTVGPGSRGVGTVWFRFVATETSARVSTCNHYPPSGDSLLQVMRVTDPDRGLCIDGSPCNLSSPFCADGSTCTIDGRFACDNLVPIGCNDDATGCGTGLNSDLCVTGLVPGDTYYIMLGAKTRQDTGVFQLDVESPCTPFISPISNDLCENAEPLTGSRFNVPFDLSGEAGGTGPATFDCPGPPSSTIDSLENDIWYDWTAPCNGTVTIDTCDGNATPDTGMVVYKGCDCPVSLATGDIVAANDFQPDPCLLGSRVTFDVEAGQCYKVRLGGDSGGTPAGTLNFNLSPTCPEPVEFLDPRAGTVDARQPHPPGDASTLQGIDSFTISGDASGATFGANGCWSLCDSDPASTNDIASITDNGDGTYTIHLPRPITPGQVTTLSYNGSSGTPTVGSFTSHPGNVNGDTISSAADVTALIDFLADPVGAPLPWDGYSGDADHSGTIGPADILRVIDILTGANGAFGRLSWDGTLRPTCGNCCPLNETSSAHETEPVKRR